ncbi:hypothetical protein BSKO_10237 [Bryopsis sp. KO-2023]|nr:hypothetical protein BSKO_10237 [Bryopsis sp. KO-2023]
MAVLLETSKGDIVIDLFVDDCPRTCLNFLKLCKIKYYNNCLFHNVQPGFIIQTGDPDGTGRGGSSVYGIMYGDQARLFEDEIRPNIKHKKKGVVGMASGGENMNGSQFYITTGESLDSLDEKHTIFGEVAEGMDIVMAINDAYCDKSGKPFQNIRIRHAMILDDPLPDPPMLAEHIPEKSPEPIVEEGDRLEDDWVPEEDSRPAEEIEKEVRRREAHNRAVVLEMVGDIPDAEVKPPSDMLFVCKLNPVTTEEDLEILFSRFGNITSCDIIRDWKTDDSLCYGFIGFDSDEACEAAYFKMNNVIIDDRRIKVDFSQSVYHLWKQFRKFGRKGMQGDGPPPPGNNSSGGPGKGKPFQSEERVELRRKGGPDRGGYKLLMDDSHLAGIEPRKQHKRSRERSDSPPGREKRVRHGEAPSEPRPRSPHFDRRVSRRKDSRSPDRRRHKGGDTGRRRENYDDRERDHRPRKRSDNLRRSGGSRGDDRTDRHRDQKRSSRQVRGSPTSSGSWEKDRRRSTRP